MSTVLVTGGSGFLGAHIIVQLLDAGHRVRATVRRLDKKESVFSVVKAGGADPTALTLCAANLDADAGWAEAMEGCDFVLHVASPFPAASPEDEDDLVRPARDGTLRVLNAAREAKVKRVVMTSSFGAIGYGHPKQKTDFDENDWSQPNAPDMQPYLKSKLLAERAAWEFAERHEGQIELCVINPTGIFGPVLGPDYSTSIGIVKAMLDGAMPFVPRLSFGVVDVRDVAALHVLAMTGPEAAGERFIAVSGEPVSLLSVANFLRSALGAGAAKAPRMELPDLAVRCLAVFVPTLRETVSQLGRERRASSAKARKMLGWRPRSAEEAIAATATSLLELPERSGSQRDLAH